MSAHGTPQCYWRGCRLPECRAAHARYEKQRSERRTLKIESFVSLEFAQGSLRHLSVKEAVIATGLHSNTIYAIRAGKVKKIRAENERKILRAA